MNQVILLLNVAASISIKYIIAIYRRNLIKKFNGKKGRSVFRPLSVFNLNLFALQKYFLFLLPFDVSDV